MMNRVALGTVLGAALLGLAKSKSGGKSSKSFIDTFEQGRSGLDDLETAVRNDDGGHSHYRANDDLLIFSKLEILDKDVIVSGISGFKSLIKKKPNTEEVYVESIKNKGEPFFFHAEKLKHLTIRGTFKALREERFAHLDNLETLTIISPNLTFIPTFIRNLPKLKRLRICAPIFNVSTLEGMSKLEFLKLDFASGI